MREGIRRLGFLAKSLVFGLGCAVVAIGSWLDVGGGCLIIIPEGLHLVNYERKQEGLANGKEMDETKQRSVIRVSRSRSLTCLPGHRVHPARPRYPLPRPQVCVLQPTRPRGDFSERLPNPPCFYDVEMTPVNERIFATSLKEEMRRRLSRT